MFFKLTEKFGKPLCALLYAVFAALAVKVTWIPLAALVLMHLTEYFTVAAKVAKSKGIDQLTAFANCLAFGFTWWLPIKKQ